MLIHQDCCVPGRLLPVWGGRGDPDKDLSSVGPRPAWVVSQVVQSGHGSRARNLLRQVGS